ncbi:hypothetical protein ACVNS2_32620 [Paenibacillus caseinilyticus]|uniref:Tryptophan-rich sensory protein n=1 Tax=Paenibacillus mucilaginosus K02 TaxID=997761 RepID=I0BSV8_9BACL|nr:hypothetical protein [Paenibacillus mucilaginosus]AFH65455.1 hypothetical protein B2K_32925 [Paenibacillus mucilaginosus K02]
MKKNVIIRWLNVAGLLAVLILNYLANALPLNNLTTGQISAMFPVRITPASYAFSIWGLIYALLVAFIIVQLWPGKRNQEEVLGANPWFLVSCFFNCTWILLWHYLYTVSSVFAMLGLLFSLIGAYVNTRPNGWSPDRVIRWFVQLPFSVYLGWITVASLVNIAIGLKLLGWGGFGLSPVTWTVLGILTAMLLGLLVGFRFRDPAYALVIAWALAAVGVANRAEAVIAYSAWGAAALLTVFSLWLLASGGLLKGHDRARH